MYGVVPGVREAPTSSLDVVLRNGLQMGATTAQDELGSPFGVYFPALLFDQPRTARRVLDVTRGRERRPDALLGPMPGSIELVVDWEERLDLVQSWCWRGLVDGRIAPDLAENGLLRDRCIKHFAPRRVAESYCVHRQA